LKSLIGGFLRHALTTLGGTLIADGYLTAQDSQLIIGGAMALFGVLWSAAQKFKTRKAA
jgi:hypothetical protein